MDDRSERIIRDLHPIALQEFRKLAQYLESSYKDGRCATLFLPFEGLRTPIKQEELFRQRPPVTHVGAWGSPHQYGLAVDFVPFRLDGPGPRGWHWLETAEWHYLRTAAALFGLTNPFDWDRAHVEHPAWKGLRTVLQTKI